MDTHDRLVTWEQNLSARETQLDEREAKLDAREVWLEDFDKFLDEYQALHARLNSAVHFAMAKLDQELTNWFARDFDLDGDHEAMLHTRERLRGNYDPSLTYEQLLTGRSDDALIPEYIAHKDALRARLAARVARCTPRDQG